MKKLFAVLLSILFVLTINLKTDSFISIIKGDSLTNLESFTQTNSDSNDVEGESSSSSKAYNQIIISGHKSGENFSYSVLNADGANEDPPYIVKWQTGNLQTIYTYSGGYLSGVYMVNGGFQNIGGPGDVIITVHGLKDTVSVQSGDRGKVTVYSPAFEGVGSPYEVTMSCISNSILYTYYPDANLYGTPIITTEIIPLPDECSTATVVNPLPFQDKMNTTVATPNATDPVLSCGLGGGGNTVWYVFTPDSAMVVSVNTFGSDYNTVIGLFTGTCGTLTEIDCNDDDSSLQSQIIFTADAGVTYFVLIGEYNSEGVGGNLVFNVKSFPRIDVSPTSFTFTIQEGGTDSSILSISNIAPLGSEDLNWNITEQKVTLLLNNEVEIPVSLKKYRTKSSPIKKIVNNKLEKIFEKITNIPSTTVSTTGNLLIPGILAISGLECINGEIHDDGTVEAGYTFFSVSDARIVELFNPGSYPFNYSQVCICWTRNSGDADIKFNIVVYDDNGPSGSPGTFIASIPVTASSVPAWPSVDFSDFDVSGLIPSINSGSVYIGVQWSPMNEQEFYICADESPATPLQMGYAYTGSWTSCQIYWSNYRAMFIRAEGDSSEHCPWLSENPTSGTISAGSGTDLDIIIDATGLTTGTYNCNLIVNSNDPNDNQLIIPVTLNVGVMASIKLYLQGPYQSDSMRTDLNISGELPLNQPYNTTPWNYEGTESVASIPSGVVDWILIELRSDLTTSVAKRAGFLYNDGKVVDLDGTSNLGLTDLSPGDYYVVVWHRNHIPIMSSTLITFQ